MLFEHFTKLELLNDLRNLKSNMNKHVDDYEDNNLECHTITSVGFLDNTVNTFSWHFLKFYKQSRDENQNELVSDYYPVQFRIGKRLCPAQIN